MFEKEVSLFYRFICLLAFLTVIILSNNFITPIVLIIFFVLATRYFDSYLYVLFYLLSIIAFIMTFIFKINIFLKIVGVFNFVLYFFNATSLKRIFIIKKKERIDKGKSEYDYIRFNEKKVKSSTIDDNLGLVYYVTFHFAILFLSILVG